MVQKKYRPEMENYIIKNRKFGEENIPKEIKDNLLSKKDHEQKRKVL